MNNQNLPMGLKQLAALRKNNLTEQEYYLRAMKGIHSLGDNPSDENVEILLKLLKNKGFKSLSEIKEKEDFFEVSEENRISNTNFREDLPNGGIRSAQFFIATLLEKSSDAKIHLEILNPPQGRIEIWLDAPSNKKLLNSPAYHKNMANDLDEFLKDEVR